MQEDVKEFRDGIFALRTRRFGTIAELMVAKLFGLGHSKNQFHDRYDEQNSLRVEIKFSTVMKANDEKINADNAVEQCIKANLANRALNSYERNMFEFDCNIQQVKRAEFDLIYYGLFFADKIAIFRMTPDQVFNCLGYSDKQHKGNEGEGQFHLNNKTIEYHFGNHFVQWLTYEELYSLFKKA